jgi:putative colanic acid biosynthesis acetyltransferase WcaF
LDKNNVELNLFSHDWYNPGPLYLRAIWYIINRLFFKTSIPYPNFFKVLLLKLFGAKLGKNIVIKHRVTIKYPWLLSIGDFSWIGENVWIDNLGHVIIGNNCCISQGAYLLTGNHDYSKKSFDLIIKGITLKDGSWIAAKAIVCPGVTIGFGVLLMVSSVATNDCIDYGIYQGNPATLKKIRVIR